MQNSITKTKHNILLALYQNQIMPCDNLAMCAKYLHITGQAEVGSVYLERILRELITEEYVERIKIGYNAMPRVKSFERRTGRKPKNVYRLTRSGTFYVEMYYRLQKIPTLCQSPILHRVPIRDERTIRVMKTEIFGTVCGEAHQNLSFQANEELRKGIENKGALSSKIAGTFLVEDLFHQQRVLPIFNTAGYITSQVEKTERKMRDEIEKKYGLPVEEEIILGDSWLVLEESIRILAKRDLTRREGKGTEEVAPLLIEPDVHTKKYFHKYGEAGVKQMRVYQIPKEHRREYYREKLKALSEFEELYTDEAVATGRTDYLFDAVTDTAYVYVGYEVDIYRVKNLYERMDATTMNAFDKGLVIICSEAQKEFYENLFKGTREMQFLKILTTKEIP